MGNPEIIWWREQLEIAFENFKKEYENILYSFIWYKDKAEFVLDDDADTFYFSPKKKVVWIPTKWLIEYCSLKDKEDEDSKLKKLDWKFALAHEFSHFRDMLKEKDIRKEASMYQVLKKLAGQKIQISDKEYIPIWKMIHDIYNCLDDIVVNYEVINFMDFGINKAQVKTLYQKINFADYIKNPNWEKELNLDKPVDYTKIPDYTAISYYFLRKKMVPDQDIVLSDNLNQILFSENGRNRTWYQSLKQLKEVFDKEVENAKNSTDPETKKRYEKIKQAIVRQTISLNELINNRDYPKTLLSKALKSLSQYDTSKISSWNISLEQIIDLFTASRGWDDWHILCILPDLRYQIYESIFDPIIRTLILIHCLHMDIKENNKKSKNWKWEKSESSGNENWEWQAGKWEDWEPDDSKESEWNDSEESSENESWEWQSRKWEDWEPDGSKESESNSSEESDWETENSGKWSYSRSLEDALKTIEEAAEYNANQTAKEKRKKQSEKVWLSIAELLNEKWVSQEDWNLKETVQKNFLSYIEQITKILYNELYALDIQTDTQKTISKKWSLNYDEFMKEFSQSFLDWDFSEKSIYERNKKIEQIKEEFKKLVFYFMIDVSGSTDWFKWQKWLLNGVPLSLAVSIKNAEKAIQNILWDASYKIPIKFIIYTNQVNYFTKDEDLKDFDLEITRVNSAILRLTWWTEDTQWWKMVWETLVNDFKTHPEYIEDIKNWDMKPVVIQIADSDVTEDGVKWLESVISQNFWEEVVRAFNPRRIILWQEIEVEKPENMIEKEKWNWAPEYVILPNWQIATDEKWNKLVRVKEIWVRSQKDIIKWIRALFTNFFADVIKK